MKNNVHKISEFIGTRTVIQIRSHLQKYKIKQMKISQSNFHTNNEIWKKNIGGSEKKKI